MSGITRGYNQIATYWGEPVSDGYGGETFAAPRSLLVRWEERSVEFSDQSGETHISKAVVFVEEPLDIGGYLYLGESAEAIPGNIKDAHDIRQFSTIPDLRRVSSEYRAYL